MLSQESEIFFMEFKYSIFYYNFQGTYFNQMILLSKPFWILSLSLGICKLTFVPENPVPPSSHAASLWPLSKPRLTPELALVLSLGYLYSWVGPWWEPLTELTPAPWAQSAQWPVIDRQPLLYKWFLRPAHMSPVLSTCKKLKTCLS